MLQHSSTITVCTECTWDLNTRGCSSFGDHVLVHKICPSVSGFRRHRESPCQGANKNIIATQRYNERIFTHLFVKVSSTVPPTLQHTVNYKCPLYYVDRQRKTSPACSLEKLNVLHRPGARGHRQERVKNLLKVLLEQPKNEVYLQNNVSKRCAVPVTRKNKPYSLTAVLYCGLGVVREPPRSAVAKPWVAYTGVQSLVHSDIFLVQERENKGKKRFTCCTLKEIDGSFTAIGQSETVKAPEGVLQLRPFVRDLGDFYGRRAASSDVGADTRLAGRGDYSRRVQAIHAATRQVRHKMLIGERCSDILLTSGASHIAGVCGWSSRSKRLFQLSILTYSQVLHNGRMNKVSRPIAALVFNTARCNGYYLLKSRIDARVQGQEARELYGRHLTRISSVSTFLRARRTAPEHLVRYHLYRKALNTLTRCNTVYKADRRLAFPSQSPVPVRISQYLCFPSVQARICKSTATGHRANHRLNLAISKACSVVSIRNAIGVISSVSNFFRESAGRIHKLETEVQDRQPHLKKGKHALKKMGSNAFSFLQALQSSEFLVSVVVLDEVFGLTLPLVPEVTGRVHGCTGRNEARGSNISESKRVTFPKSELHRVGQIQKLLSPDFNDGFEVGVLQVAARWRRWLPTRENGVRKSEPANLLHSRQSSKTRNLPQHAVANQTQGSLASRASRSSSQLATLYVNVKATATPFHIFVKAVHDKAEEYITYMQVDLKQDFQKCSFYRIVTCYVLQLRGSWLGTPVSEWEYDLRVVRTANSSYYVNSDTIYQGETFHLVERNSSEHGAIAHALVPND
ncbi:hypothetical protein PR048_004460 [Dryococelus australis]|uniref:Uncharacterized protein n=1 Tax=Dryococelus australis TaxID=614101 RepID=A0ABQ9I5H4_9NEOP|nr:hypothetical protein PR048_004460 [Dryococelus australis]